MKLYLRTTPILLLLIASFTYLFYEWEFGINVFLFDGLLLLLLLRVRPELASWPAFRWAVACLLPSAISVVVVHSVASAAVHLLSFFLLIGFAQARELRFVWFALLLSLESLFAAPLLAWRSRSRSAESGARTKTVWQWVKQLVLPLGLLWLFCLLYISGNSDFAGGLSTGLTRLGDWLAETPFLYLCLLVCLGALLIFPLFYAIGGGELNLDAASERLSDVLVRTRRRTGKRFHPLALLTEYRRTVLTLGLLNALILTVNLTDVRNVWSATGTPSAAILSEYVHTGTTNLIFSILLAMGVVLYGFRGNLNFLPASKLLRRLTYAWLAQNAFMALSVGLRNWQYIEAYGLALGRIYVLFGLTLIVVGLFTLFRKVKFRLSFTYLLQVNGLAVWLFLIAFAGINWSGVITRTNLARPTETIDWVYLIDGLEGSNIRLLLSQRQRMPSPMREKVDRRATEMSARANKRDWRGWNYADHRNR